MAASGDKTYTLREAELHFAKSLNGQVWDLLQKPDRTQAEDERMVHCAHASCCYWLQAGTGLQHQRGEWLVTRVYTVLGLAEAALRHAARCMELTREHAALMKDFDWAYAYEGLARANALAGSSEEARRYLALAEEAGRGIQNEEDRQIFTGDFSGGDWYGLR